MKSISILKYTSRDKRDRLLNRSRVGLRDKYLPLMASGTTFIFCRPRGLRQVASNVLQRRQRVPRLLVHRQPVRRGQRQGQMGAGSQTIRTQSAFPSRGN